MPFCMNCGLKLPDGAKFCYQCGTPLGSVSPSGANSNEFKGHIQYETMLKCPNCGSSIGKLDAVCPYCGAQIAHREASSTVRRFADELSRIEAEAAENNETNTKGLLGALLDIPGEDKSFESAFGNKTFERKISLINSFPIPNTVEEISEFVLLAVANIDDKYGKKSFINRINGSRGVVGYTDTKLAITWVNKLEQAYNKAEISFPNHPLFQKIKTIYENKMKKLNRL